MLQRINDDTDVMKYGKYKGKTVREIANIEPQYLLLEWEGGYIKLTEALLDMIVDSKISKELNRELE